MNKCFNAYLRGIQSRGMLLSILVLTLVCYQIIDIPLAVLLHQPQLKIINDLAQPVTRFGLGTYYIIGLFLMALTAKYVLRSTRWFNQFLFLFLSIVVPGLLCDILKIIVSRARPTLYFADQQYGFYWFKFKAVYWSFPSGHTSTITGVMLALSLLYPRYFLSFLSFAFIVSITRVLINAHYLSDIFAGFYLSSITVLLLYRYFLYNHGFRYQRKSV